MPVIPLRVLVIAVVLLLSGRADAQNRNMMVSDDGNGNVEFLSWSIPDLDIVKTPDFTAHDLRTMESILALSDAQRDAIGEIIQRYQAALDAVELEGESQGGPRRGGPAAGQEQDGAEAVRKAIGEELERAGIDPAMLENDQLDLSVGISMQMDDGPNGPEPALGVDVSLGPAEGVNLSDEMMAQLQEAASAIADRIKEIEGEKMRERLEAMMNGEGAGEGPGEGFAKKREELEALRQAIKAYRKVKRRLHSSTVNEMHALLSEGQIARWPGLERHLRRERTLPWGLFSGESVDLAALWESMEIPANEMIDALLEQYLSALDSALVRRNTALETTDAEVDRAIDAGDAKTALAAQDKLRRLRQAVRDVNRSNAELIAGQLDAESREDFEALVRDSAYARLTADTPADRAFAAIRQLSGLSASVMASVEELEAAYANERGSMDNNLERLLLRHEPREMMQSLASAIEMIDEDAAAKLLEERNPLPEAFERRLGLDARYMKLVYGLLPPEMVEQLPRLPETKMQQPVRAQRFEGGDS